MEFKKIFSHSNGAKQYELTGFAEYWFMYPSFDENNIAENKVRYVKNDNLISHSAATLNDAIKKYKTYLYSLDRFKKKSINHGGSRKGAGRKKQPPTKPVRLSEDEQILIRELRTSEIDQHTLIKQLVKFMAVCELEELNKPEVDIFNANK